MATFPDKLRGIGLVELPLSYKDAIRVAQDLGIQYLWIDSLCIIQDDQDDWEIESGSMASIYGCAYLVIGADCASDSREGFLTSSCSNPAAYIATIQNDDNSTSPIYTRHELPHFDSRYCLAEWSTLMECECRELADSPFASEYKSTLELEAAAGLLEGWDAVVNQFHKRSFTYGSDFLPALSGIAKRLQNFGAGEYLSGLWKNNLYDELLWGAAPYFRFHRPQTYRTPTWSWASINGSRKDPKYNGSRIDFYSGKYGCGPCEPMCQIHNAQCTPAGHDATGAVVSGEITIVGKMIPIVGYKGFNRTNDQGVEEVNQPNTRKLYFPNLEEYSGVSQTTLWGMTSQLDLAEEDYEGIQLWGLLIGRWNAARHTDSRFAGNFNFDYACTYKSGYAYGGLILQKTKDQNNNFERAGAWRMILQDKLLLEQAFYNMPYSVVSIE
ncbi:Nn.00g058960.m01.CDS01 [Neocucurbitaria sp. VM-36]